MVNKTVATGMVLGLAVMSQALGSGLLGTSFENDPRGVFTELHNEAGQWTTIDGKAEITSAYAKSGSQSLRLFGGTLVFAAQFKDEHTMPHATIVYSRDRGKNWSIGTGAKSNTTEAQVVELSDGSLMLNMRDNRGGSRSVYTTDDLGKTWKEHPTSRSALPEPVCMASLIRFSRRQSDQDDILLFSNPAVSSGPRRHMTIKASLDDGMTWPSRFHKLVHEPSSAGYSCLTQIDDQTVGILYEGGATALLVFEKLHIDEILGSDESVQR